MTALGVALKEWAAICLALAEGRQTILLRKGGIAEPGGAFRVEHPRFWLMPTYVHQQQAGLAEAYRDLLPRSRAEQPLPGLVRLTHFAEVAAVCHCDTVEQALSLEGEHGWSREAVEARFRYRAPGLFVLAVRVYRAGRDVEMPLTPYFEGCKSWVELGREEPVGPALPVMPGGAFTTRCRPLERLIAAARTSGA